MMRPAIAWVFAWGEGGEGAHSLRYGNDPPENGPFLSARR
jgi:hypothetical protein